MRVFILISGLLRTFFDNLFNFLNDYIQITNNEVYILISTTSSSNDTNFMVSDYKEHLASLYKLKNYIVFIDNITEIKEPEDLSQREKNIVHQYYRLTFLIKYLNNLNVCDDDIVVRLRPDIKFEITPSLFDSYVTRSNLYNGLLVPKGNDICSAKFKTQYIETINDQIAFGRYIYMKYYCSVYDIVDFKRCKRPLISEEILYKILKDKPTNIERIDIPYTLLLSECKIIAIAGDSGAGKTTITQALRKCFPFDKNVILETDRYHKWERGNENWKTLTHLNPNANYLERMADDTYMLKMGDQVQQVDYDHSSGKFTDQQVIESKNYIFLCGLHTMYQEELRLNTDLKIYVDTETNLKKVWKITRDMKKRGYSYEKCIEIFNKRQEDYFKYIVPQKKYADLVIYYYTTDYLEEIFNQDYVCKNIKMSLKVSKIYKEYIHDYLTNFIDNYSIEDQIIEYFIVENINKESLYALLPNEYKKYISKLNIHDSYLGVIQVVILLIIMNPN